METDKSEKLSMEKIPTLKNNFPASIAKRFALYPENKRRPVNKILFKNRYFQLKYNMRENSMEIASNGDLVYSAIPYDTGRNYIQRGAIHYLLHPDETRSYIESHKANLEKYLMKSIFQVSKRQVTADSPEVQEAYAAIFQNPLLEIQILGRLLQHDETGPLSANLAGKFLFSENVKTGIAGYLAEYLNFVLQVTRSLPLVTDGKEIILLAENQDSMIKQTKLLSVNSDVGPALALLPPEISRGLWLEENQPLVNLKPLLRSEYGAELTNLRENYVAHSLHPDELSEAFENVHRTENTNLLNVVSDIHSLDGKIPFSNRQFNILAGDISGTQVKNDLLKGLLVLGNHELTATLAVDPLAEKWQPFVKYQWFQQLLQDPNEAWYLLPTGEDPFYEVVKRELEKNLPQLEILNNRGIVHEGIRYIGLTVPVALVERKKQQQHFLRRTLEKLLGKDQRIPTVIVSHAPLFNELSMLSPKSEAYHKDYTCDDSQLEALFKRYNIIGAIHGHHHIPASAGRYKMVQFAGNDLFVVCSIYSKINTGFDLQLLLNTKLIQERLK